MALDTSVMPSSDTGSGAAAADASAEFSALLEGCNEDDDDDDMDCGGGGFDDYSMDGGGTLAELALLCSRKAKFNVWIRSSMCGYVRVLWGWEWGLGRGPVKRG